MAHTKVTKAYSANTGAANTFSYSGSFDVFKATEVVVTLDTVDLTYTASTINESASPREYTVDTSAKTIHIGGANLSSGTIIIRPVTDMGSPTARATFTPGSSINSSDINNNQTQLLRKAMEYDDISMKNTGDTMTGHLTLGEDATIIFEGATDNAYETTLTVTDPTADRPLSLPNESGTLLTTGGVGTVAVGNMGANSVDSDQYVDGSIDTVHIGDVQVTTAKIANDAVTNAKIADNSIDSEHYVDGSIDTAHIADTNVTLAKVENVTNGNIIVGDGSNRPASVAVSGDVTIANTGAVTIASNAVEIGMIGCEQTTISDSDSHLPTSGAVVDYVAAQIAPIGGLEVIATDAAFPNTQPQAGVVISIADAGGLVVNGSGVSTTGRTVGGSTVTINGINSSYNSSTITAGVGFLVSSTGSGQIYNFHKSVIRDQDIQTISTDINDFANRYRVASSAPGSDNDEGDLYYDTSANKMKVYDGSSWDVVTSTGEFKFITLVDTTTTNAAGYDGSKDTYDLIEGTSTSGSAASIVNAYQLIVSLNGVIQKPNEGTFDGSGEGFYKVDSNTIRFCDPPPSGSSVFVVLMGSALTINEPGTNTVATTSIQNGAVSAAKLATNAVETAKINADAVTGAKIADDSINSEHYVDGSIDTQHIAADQITAALIADDVINSEHIAAGAVDLEHMSSESVDEDNLKVSNSPTNGYYLQAQSGNAGGMTWAAVSQYTTPLTTEGDILYRDGSGDARLAKGSAGQVLKMNSGASAPEWGTAGVSISNDANNRVTTADGSAGLVGEANLTFDGTTLTNAGNTISQGYESPATVAANWSIGANNNAMFPGPMTVASGVTVTVPANRTLTIV